VILEGMASGLPVVSTCVGGIPEVLKNGENGFLVNPNDPPAFANAIEILAKSRELRQGLGKKGKKLVVKNFDLEENTQKLLNLLLKHSERLRQRIYDNSPDLKN